jgi:beta-lactamase regulating signal transducer with metallopeptidase domain
MVYDIKIKPNRIIQSTMMCGEKNVLKERLNAIMKSKKHSKRVITFSYVLLAIVFCGTILLGAYSNQNYENTNQDELLSAMHRNVPPDGLTIEIIE